MTEVANIPQLLSKPSTRDAIGLAVFQNSMYTVVDKSRTWDDHLFIYKAFYFIKRYVDSFESSKFIDSISDILLLSLSCFFNLALKESKS